MHGGTAFTGSGNFRLARLREQFSGLGYVVLITLATIVCWSLRALFYGWPYPGTATALTAFGHALWANFLATFPPLPLVVIAANQAPPTGLRRYATFAGAMLIMVLWCAFYAWAATGHMDPLANYFEAAPEAFITVMAYAYRSSARGASSALLRSQIDVAALDAEAKRARLQLLRAQIEPHFLFNTLATVRTLARIDRLAAVEMLDNLMRYFSEALPRLREDESSLAEELELIDAYLRIHQIRMGNRLAYELRAPAELRGARVPTMMLLTLVENALKHGIHPTVEGGRIRVSAAHESSALVLKVADTGRGMTALQGHGTGLANIRMRLSMLYGEKAALSLAQGDARGVVATISIPLASMS
jgi:signal transduction histidine kinase